MRKKLPEAIQVALIQEQEIEPSALVQKAINNEKRLPFTAYEESLAKLLIELAVQTAQEIGCPRGEAIAAAFDLFVAAYYYKNAANGVWYPCQDSEPLLIYPFLNACPRCAVNGQFYFEEANKPPSGSIGKVTSNYLAIFLDQLSLKSGKRLEIYLGPEPVDMTIFDRQTNTVLLSEIKAAPLTTLPLVARNEKSMNSKEGLAHPSIPHDLPKDGRIVPIQGNPFSDGSEIYMFLPIRRNGSQPYRLVSLGTEAVRLGESWAYQRIEQALSGDENLFREYLDFWRAAFAAYGMRNDSISTYYWLTGACGEPRPRPSYWPGIKSNKGVENTSDSKKKKKRTVYEKISDNKTSVGMDRTDDIKKGTYQVLGVAIETKLTKSNIQVKTALFSNIHAVRHYEDYLAVLEKIVWVVDEDKGKSARKAVDLPSDAEVYNLFDGVLSFTRNHIRDEWIEKEFLFLTSDISPR